jgi:hypothetical protein
MEAIQTIINDSLKIGRINLSFGDKNNPKVPINSGGILIIDEIEQESKQERETKKNLCDLINNPIGE